MPRAPRLALAVLGAALLLYALATFAVPELAARVLSGWMALLGVGGAAQLVRA